LIVSGFAAGAVRRLVDAVIPIDRFGRFAPSGEMVSSPRGIVSSLHPDETKQEKPKLFQCLGAGAKGLTRLH
jgi:hypothetical protein